MKIRPGFGKRFAKAAALCLCLAAPSLAQDLPPGDYRLSGREEDGDAVEVLLHVTADAEGALTFERSAVPVEREDLLEKTRVFRSQSVTRDGDAIVVVYQQAARGLCSILDRLGDDDDDDEPLTARYLVAHAEEGAALKVYERATRDGELSLAQGTFDHPTLELVREARVADLVGDRLDRYEASGVALVDGAILVAFDNSTRLARIDPELGAGELIQTSGNGESNFEGLTHDPRTGTTYALVEYARRGNRWYGRVWELDEALERDRDERLRGYRLPGHNKGFEGLAHVRHEGEDYLLALLEGNHGEADDASLDRGHGRIVVFARDEDDPDDWTDHAELRLPRTANFSDYSGLDVQGGRIVVVSQTSSLVWTGSLDPDGWTVDAGQVYRLPRAGTRLRYGSVEGIAWLDAEHLVAVSDSSADCADTAESVHVFKLP